MKPHAKLRGALTARDITGQYLARRLLKSGNYISERMVGRKPWNLDECYKIMDMIGAPYTELAEYFPPKGGVQQ